MPKRALMVGVGIILLAVLSLTHVSSTSPHSVAFAAGTTTTSTTATLQPITTTSTTTIPVVPETTTTVAAPVPAPKTTTTTVPAPEPKPAPVVEAAPEPEPQPQPEGSAEGAIATYFGDVYNKAIRVARCESGLQPGIVSPGGGNFGLFQINKVHAQGFYDVTGVLFSEGWSNPYLNAQYARALYDSASWGPWSCGGA